MTVQVTAPQTRAAIPDSLEEPRIRQAPDGINLDPMEVSNTDRLTAEIKRKSQGLLETDGIVLELTGWNPAEPRGSYISNEGKPLPFGPPELRILNLEPKVVVFNLGQKITVKYTVSRDDEMSVTSDELELNVLDLQPKALKAGVIFGKNDDGTGPVLDLTTDTDDRTVRIEIWPLIAVGQWLWIVLTGEKENGDPYELTLFEGEVDQATITLGYFEVLVLFSELMLLGDGTDVTLQYKVAFDQVKDESKANLSQVRSYTVKAAVVVAPKITAVTDSSDNPVADNGETTDSTLKLEGTAGEGEEVEIYVGNDLKETVKALGGIWKSVLTGLGLTTHVIKAVASDLNSNTWTVTVKAVEVKPTIDEVTDSAGRPITNPGMTTSAKTPLKATVTVASWGRFGLYSGSLQLGFFTAEGPTTELIVTQSLSRGKYVLQAIGMDNHNRELKSDTWNVDVWNSDVTPQIIEMRYTSDGSPIHNGDTIPVGDVQVTVKITPGRKGEIVSELQQSSGRFDVDGAGVATQRMNFRQGTHYIRVLEYPDDLPSPVFLLTVS